MSVPTEIKIGTEDAARCMKCGFCMSTCPVYGVEHVEGYVARGRNMLIRMVEDQRTVDRAHYAKALQACLLCGRCQMVCPAKVPSVQINLEARQKLFAQRGASFGEQILYRGILKHRPLMARLMTLSATVLAMTPKDKVPLRHMADAAALLSGRVFMPPVSRPFLAERFKNSSISVTGHKTGKRVAIFPGCGFEFFFSDAGYKIALVLAQLGFEVIYPKDLTCCGMAVYNGGDGVTARLMAGKNMKALSEFDHIVTGCATCGSTLKNYPKWFAGHKKLYAGAKKLSEKVYDFSQIIAAHFGQGEKKKSRPVKVTYHDPCHLKWHQGISDLPRKVIQGLGGVEFVEMEKADACCGLGGAFGLKQPRISRHIQAEKMASIRKTGAEKVVTTCPGCMIQLMDGAKRHGLDIEVLHLSQLVAADQM